MSLPLANGDPRRRPAKKPRSPKLEPSSSSVPSVPRASGEAGRRSSKIIMWTIAAIFVIAAILYGCTLTFPFQFDGIFYILGNPLVKDSGSFAFWKDFTGFATAYERLGIIQDLSTNFILRPVSYFTFHLNYLLGGMRPEGFRAVNIFIHAANASLLLLVLGQVFQRGDQPEPASSLARWFLPLTAALLFLVHPLQTESVTYIVQRFTLLAAFFTLLSLYLALLAARSGSAVHAWWLRSSAWVATLAGMLCKESVFMAPIMILGAEMLLLRMSFTRSLKQSWGYLLTLPLLPVLVYMVTNAQRHGQVDTSSVLNIVNFGDRPVTPWQYALSEPAVILHYLGLLLVPMGQTVDHDPAVVSSLWDAHFLLPMAAILGIIAGAWRLMHRHSGDTRWALIFYGVLWFFITVLPSSSLVPLPDLMAEHRSYLPSIGFFMAAAAALDLLRSRWAGSRSLCYAVPSAAIAWTIALAAATMNRNEVWRTDISLWSDAVAKCPGKARSWDNLGISHYQAGHAAESVECLKHALAADPGYINAYCKLGLVWNIQAQYAEALEVSQAGLKRAPLNADLCYDAAMAYNGMGKVDEAQEWLLKTIKLQPNHGSAHFSLGVLYSALQKSKKAIAHLQLAATLLPDDPRVGVALSQEKARTQTAGR